MTESKKRVPCEERWLPAVGYEGNYVVSNSGRVKRIARGPHTSPGKILRLNRRPNGYDCVELFNKGESRRKSVHRLVAKAFLPNPEDKPVVHHKNRNRADNRVGNLEWATYSAHLQLDGRKMHGEHGGMSKLTELQVARIREIIGSQQFTLGEVAGMYGVHKSTIAAIADGRLWTHSGGAVKGRRRTRKLSAEVVEFCRYLHYEKGYTQARLAKMAGVHRATISRAVRGESWASL